MAFQLGIDLSALISNTIRTSGILYRSHILRYQAGQQHKAALHRPQDSNITKYVTMHQTCHQAQVLGATSVYLAPTKWSGSQDVLLNVRWESWGDSLWRVQSSVE